MATADESNIRFDFGDTYFVRHGQDGDGNTNWKGVDFRIQLKEGWLWLEVKNWNPPASKSIPAEIREVIDTDYQDKTKDETLTQDLVSKFLGTTAFLAWKEGFKPQKVDYVALLVGPPGIDAAQISGFNDNLSSHTGNHVKARVISNLEDWNRIYPKFPATLID